MKQRKNKNQERRERFEEIYIRTFQKTYHYIRLLTTDNKKVKKLLILTYADLYSNMEDIFGKSDVSGWIQEKADDIAELKMGISPEQVRVARFKNKTEDNSVLKEEKSVRDRNRLDEASVFLEIEDYLKLDDMDSRGESSKALLIFKNIFACGFLVTAVGFLVIGADKIRKQIDLLKAPFLESMSAEEDLLEAQKNQKKHIKIAKKIVYLSDIGQVLYSIPLDQSEWASEDPENPEIQTSSDGWVYYLPCPERENSVLKNVSPNLHHTLYRIKNGKEEIEIISAEVDDYSVLDDKIYIESFDRIQVIDSTEEFEKMVPDFYIEIKNCEFYMRDTLGRAIERENDGNIYYEDRIFQMDADRIADVVQAERKKGDSNYVLREQEEGKKVIYRITGGVEEVFIQQNISVDSFCMAGDWIYYSACVRGGETKKSSSRIFRKSLVDDSGPEQIHGNFSGRINQMYYCEENGQIYGNYIPKNWSSNHGVIAVIGLDGQMSYIDDTEQRASRETTGNDILEFIMMKNGKIYCYWKDFQWENGREPEILWRDVIIISDGDRIKIKN